MRMQGRDWSKQTEQVWSGFGTQEEESSLCNWDAGSKGEAGET